MANRIDIGQLMIELNLKDNFSKELAGINKDIRNLEKEMKNLDKSFGDTSKSMVGLQQKQQLLNQAIEKSQTKISKQVTQRDKLIDKYNEEKKALAELESQGKGNTAEASKLKQSMLDTANQINKVNQSIQTTTKSTQKYVEQSKQVQEQMDKLANNTQTYNEKIEGIAKSSNQLVDELETQEQILTRQGKTWKAYSTTVAKNQEQLRASVEIYQTSSQELTRLQQVQQTLTQQRQENLTVLEQEQRKEQEILQTHGEVSKEYQNQANHVQKIKDIEASYNKQLIENQQQIEKVTQTLQTSKKEVALYTQSMNELGNTKVTQTLNNMSQTFESFGQSLAPVSATSTAVGGGAVKMFTDYESGLAKVSTLVDTKVTDMKQVGADIVKISNETGQSVTSLLESAYQALSAGRNVGDLNDFLATTSKLATAGFTDSTSAVKLMCQILNNYGDEAGTAEQIASKLIQTQNLGVECCSIA